MKMTTMRRITIMILCMVLVFSMAPLTASAATQSKEDMHAEVLKELHLMAGSPEGMKLHMKPTRVEAITMLIHMMGEFNTAVNGSYSHPFQDVPEWANAFVGYAYENNLTSGVSETAFGSTQDCNQMQYLTFILRSLGYSDANGDFAWDNPYALAKKVGLIDSETPLRRFSRGDMASVSFRALNAEVVALREIQFDVEESIHLDDEFDMAEGDFSTTEPVEYPDLEETSEGAVEDPEYVEEPEEPAAPAEPMLLKDFLIRRGIFTQEEYAAAMADYQLGPKQVKAVYLTFDDGPSSKVTPRILNILRDNAVPATFFVLGSSVDANPALVRREYQEGHKIATHGYSHNYNKIYASTDALLSDIAAGSKAIDRALGFAYKTDVFRFPGGSHQKSAALKNAVTNAGYRYYDWTSSGEDAVSSKGSSAQFILDSTIKTIWGDRNNVIVLLHDTNSKGTTADALPGIINYFRSNGYVFKTL